MKKIVVLANYAFGIYKQRAEVFEELLKDGYDVYICTPKIDGFKGFEEIGCKTVHVSVDRRGKNLFKDVVLFLKYLKILSKLKPNLVLTYSIKPNVYGGLACRILGVNAIHTVTGLGSVYIRKMKIEYIVRILNRLAFKSSTVFFLNNDNKEFYIKKRIISRMNEIKIVPGSGVNLKKFKYHKMPNGEKIVFSFIGRVFKDKGIEEFLLASRYIKAKYSNVMFNVVGIIDNINYKALIDEAVNDNIIIYYGRVDNVIPILSSAHCIVLPSYGEGRGTVLQEGAALGRILIASNVYGCKDNVVENYNGYLCEVGDWKSLFKKMEKVIMMTDEERVRMGLNSNKMALDQFDRKNIIKEYVSTIEALS